MRRIIFTWFSFLSFVSLTSFQDCSDSAPIASEDVLSTVIDTLVDNSQNPVQVTIPGMLDISIPVGTVPDGSKLSIKEMDASYYPTDDLHEIQKVYDIKIGTTTEFENEITITLNYDPTLLESSPVMGRLGAAYYNKDLKRWLEFKDVTFDSVLYTVSFKTNHLTHVTFYEFCTNGRLPFKFESKHFTIYYALSGTKKVPDNDAYKTEAASWNIVSSGYVPYYITDLSHWLEEAYDKFSSNSVGFTVPTSPVNVYVTSLSGSEGEFGSVAGCIYISNSVQVSSVVNNIFTQAGWLKMTAAHELLHYIQDYYFLMNWSPNQWWLEATATQADRIIWDDQTMYESEAYTKIKSNKYGSALHYALSKSWNDCNAENWYQAGCFLYYLAHYRNGSKLDVPELIKKGGGNYLTILNDAIISTLESDVSKEYRDYVTYLYEAGNQNFALEWSSVYTEDHKTEINGYLRKLSPSKRILEKIPPLSTRIIKLKNVNSDAKQVMISINSLSAEAICSIYQPVAGNMVFETSGEKGDSLYLNFDLPKIRFKDILIINTSSENVAYLDINFALGSVGIEPASIEDAQLLGKYQFKAVFNETVPAGVKYIWKVLPDNLSFENTTGVFEYIFMNVGIYQIELTMLSKDLNILGKSVCEVKVLPTITGIDKSEIKPGDEIEISGMNFGSDASEGSVYFNGVEATEIISWGMWSIKVKVPDNAQSGDLIVTVNGTESNSYPIEIGVLEKVTIQFSKVDNEILGVSGNTITISFEAEIMAPVGAGLNSVDEYFGVGRYGSDTTLYHELEVKVNSGTIGSKLVRLSVSFSGPTTTEIIEGEHNIDRFLGWDSLEVIGFGDEYKVKGSSTTITPSATESLKFPHYISCDYRRFEQWYSATQGKEVQEYSYHKYVIQFGY